MGKGRRLRACRNAARVGPYEPAGRVRAFGTEAWLGHVRFENDRRSSGVRGRCGICLCDAELRLSHVHPKWAYRWMKYEGDHLVSYRADHDASVRMQDGSKHYLLCGDCEQLLGDGENRLRLLSSGAVTELRTADVDVCRIAPQEFEIGMSERDSIARALLGICLKAHYAPSISNSIHSDRIVRRIAEDILAGRFGGYSFAAAKWYGVESGNPRAYCGISFDWTTNGSTIAQVGLAGFDWWVVLDGSIPDALQAMDPWRIHLTATRGRKVWFEDWEFHVDGSLPRGFRGMSCPCGSYRKYEDCCQDTWHRWLNHPDLDLAGTRIGS